MVLWGNGLWYVVVFTLRGVVWHCNVLWCVALRVGTWRGPQVTSVVVFLRCAVFLFVFLLRCAFNGAVLCPGVWYLCFVACRWVTPCYVVWCRVVSCGVVACRLVVRFGVLPCGLLRCVLWLLVG